MPRPQRIEPGPGQESVWDYPRPPRLEASSRRCVVVLGGITLIDSTRGQRVLETSHPPTWYFPPEDVKLEYFHPVERRSFCEWKGEAEYFDIAVGDRRERAVAWRYPEPTRAFVNVAGYISLYPGRMDSCEINGERVQAQAGDFYGGWITQEIVGPFKGEPGTWGW